jgi:hypothetical protein
MYFFIVVADALLSYNKIVGLAQQCVGTPFHQKEKNHQHSHFLKQ